MTKEQSPPDLYDPQYQIITARPRIQSILRPIVDKHNLISITFPDNAGAYSSVLLNADPDADELTIDALHPAAGIEILARLGFLNLDTQLDGVQVQFRATFKKHVMDQGAPCHVLAFPDSIKYRQRRQSFRAQVMPTYDINVSLQAEKGAQFNGQLFDISVGGMCLRFPLNKNYKDKLPKDHVMASLYLPDDSQVNCRIKITHTFQNETTNSLHAGIQFINLDKAQHRAIERFVADLQRKKRQGETR